MGQPKSKTLSVSSNLFQQTYFFVLKDSSHNPVGSYLLRVKNRNTRIRCEICSKLTINTPEQSHRCRSGVFIVNFDHISPLVLMCLLLTLNFENFF